MILPRITTSPHLPPLTIRRLSLSCLCVSISISVSASYSLYSPLIDIAATAPARLNIDPKDVPPPTPVSIPRFQPYAHDDDPVDPATSLSALLQNIGRSASAALGPPGFSAIGLDLNLDASAQELIPDPSYIPNFAEWDKLALEDARDKNDETRRPIRNGNLSPGCQVYLERKKELSNSNEGAFRAVRRIQAPKGKQQARLGNTYEFFRCLEAFTAFWDDPTAPPQLPPSPEATADTASPQTEGAPEDAKAPGQKQANEFDYYRTGAGSDMPAEFRTNLTSAFIKLVAYDFGCNVSPSRVEPRLHLCSPEGSKPSRKTSGASNCLFVFQSPTTREAARAGVVCGPVAAVSVRGTTDFSVPDMETAQSLDLAREVVAALITAQHRAREGKKEKRFGDGQWWTVAKRWGGGSGGPIGREVDKDAAQADKESKANDGDSPRMPAHKKPRKNMSMYDNYRMVRPPSSSWDRKAQYEAIGRQQGADFDDIFVVSSLFHHISVLRVRVPNRLLKALEGASEKDPARRSWGKVQAWRSPWFDLFDTEQRLEAMKLIWSMMAYQMRKEGSDEDVKMENS